jgi:hypothetical protein
MEETPMQSCSENSFRNDDNQGWINVYSDVSKGFIVKGNALSAKFNARCAAQHAFEMFPNLRDSHELDVYLAVSR